MIYLPLYAAAALYVLWMFYLAVMSLVRARDASTLHPVARALGLPIVWVGVTMNVTINWTILTVVFLEPPRERMFSDRVERHCLHGRGWRKVIACAICHWMLDPFDPSGRHCDG